MNLGKRIPIHFVHSAPTPHNNFLLDELGRHPDIDLHLHYIYDGRSVPGRPWKSFVETRVSARSIRTGISRIVDFRLMKLAMVERPSVFFIIGWDYLSLALLIALIGILRRPLLMWDDGPTPDAISAMKKLTPKTLVKRILINLINRTPGCVFVTGNRAANGLAMMAFNERKLRHMPFFCRRGTFDISMKARLGLLKDDTIILAAGRIIYTKGFDLYVEALARLREKCCSGWCALLLGSGPELKEIKAKANHYGLGEKLRFVEWAEPDEYLSYIELCDIFVSPARFDYYPTTIISAMQAGKVVVITENVGWAGELVKAGINGVVVPVGNVESLASSLMRLVLDSTLRNRIGGESQKTINDWPVTRGVELIVRAAKESLGICAAS